MFLLFAIICVYFIHLELCYSCENVCRVFEHEVTRNKCLKGCRFYSLIDAIQSTQVFEFKLIECRLACEEAYLGVPAACQLGCQRTSNLVFIDNGALEVDPSMHLPIHEIVPPQSESVYGSTDKGGLYMYTDSRVWILVLTLIAVLFYILVSPFSHHPVKNQKLSIYGDGDELKMISEKVIAVPTKLQLVSNELPLASTKIQPINSLPFLPIQTQIQDM